MAQSTANHSNRLHRAGVKEWIGLAILGLPTLLISVDVTVMYLALPHLAADLQPSSTQQLWIMDIYTFLLAGFLVTMGALGDRVGRRKLLLLGAAAFGVVSLIAAFSTSAEMLIVARALLGIAGATLMPSTLSLISNLFPNDRQRSIAIGIWTTCFSAGTALGPAVGGILLESFHWGSIFLLAAPVMFILCTLGPIFLPEYRSTKKASIDILSVILSLAMVLPIVYGIKQLAKNDQLVFAILMIVVGLMMGFILILRQRSLAEPLFELRLFQHRNFTIALCIMLFSMIALGGSYFFISQYLQMVMGLSPLASGLWMIPMASGFIFGALLSPFVARFMSKAYVAGVGLAIAACGFLILSQVKVQSEETILVIGAFVAFFGMNMTLTQMTDFVISSVSQKHVGSASAFSETSGELGSALSVAILGSVGMAVYRMQIEDVIPAGTPTGAANIVRDNLAGALHVIEKLPTTIAEQLVASTREAFMSGMNVVTVLSALVVSVLAIICFTMLREVDPNSLEETSRKDT